VIDARGRLQRVVEVGRRAAAAQDWPVVAAGALGFLAMVEVIARNATTTTTQGDSRITTSLLLCFGVTLPVAVARAHPLPAAIATTAATLLTLATGNQITAAGVVAQLAVLYLVGLRCSGIAALLLLLPFLGYTFTQLENQNNACIPPLQNRNVRPQLDCTNQPADGSSRRAAILFLGSTAAVTALGRGRRLHRESVDRSASSQFVADTLVEHAARGERARIARELHDVVAHHISMISVQAETARLTTPGMPADGAKRLVAIGDTAREALTEMRRLLGVLREDAGVGPQPTRAPQPGIAQLIELVDEARESAGASTRLIVHGAVSSLDPGVELTAFRIVQEALTNSRRHAPGAAVDVLMDFADDALHVRIRDNGPGPPTEPGAGHGLLGMRERAAMVGGTLWTGPAPASGFQVEAVLPTDGSTT
jgi:signal transduction histidine kinase